MFQGLSMFMMFDFSMLRLFYSPLTQLNITEIYRVNLWHNQLNYLPYQVWYLANLISTSLHYNYAIENQKSSSLEMFNQDVQN